MSTAVRKQDQNPVDPYDTVTGQIVRLETATETMADYIGYLHNEVREEKKRTQPDEAKIKALEEQCLTIVRERKDIKSDDESLINKALYVYAPFLKALRKS